MIVLGVVNFFSCNTGNVPGKAQEAILSKIGNEASAVADKKGLLAGVEYYNLHYFNISDPDNYDAWARLNFIGGLYAKYGQINNNSGYYRQALVCADSMINIFDEEDRKKTFLKEYGSSYFLKGDAQFGLGMYEAAFRDYYTGKQLVDKILSPACRIYFNSRLALVDYRQQNFRQSAALFLACYHTSLKLKQDFDVFTTTQGYLDNAGLCYENLRMYDSARTCFNTVLDYLKRNGVLYPEQKRFTDDAIGVTYGYLGMIAQDAGKTTEAANWYKKSIEMNSFGGNERRNTQLILLKLARIYLNDKKYAETDHLIGAIRRSLDTLPNQRAELDWHQLKWNYLFDTKQPLSSTPYLLNYIRLRDSAGKAERQLAAADANNSFRQIRLDNQVAILKEEGELHFMYIVLISIFSGLSVVIALLVWRDWRRTRSNNAVLRGLNKSVKEQNDRLRETLTDLEQSQEENTKMLQVVAHDLRNPIGGITSVAALMLDDPTRSDDDRMFLELIKTSGQNSLELVSDLLQVHSRAEELVKEPVELSDLLNYCAGLLRFKAEAKSQRLELLLNPVVASVNREKLWRVVSNLVANAIKFSPSGGNIQIKLESDENSALISVKDDGIGIPEEMQDKIFDMFTKAKRPGTAGEQPFGLGLAISKQIIEAHGGKIWLESRPGHGTTFYVELPR